MFFGSFVLAAVATPSTDPFTMLCMAVPMTLLFYLSELICHGLDKRKGIVAAEEKQAAGVALEIKKGLAVRDK